MAQTLRNTITYFQQSSFAAGELSPDMYGRIDFNKYDVGLSDCTNMYPLPFGGVVSRPGTEYIFTLADSDKKVQLIPFQVSTKISYVLVFVSDGNLYFLTNRGVLLSDDGSTPYSIKHSFNDYEIGNIKYAQSADVIFLTVNTHQPMKLSRYGVTDWRFEAFVTDGGPFMAINDTDITLSYDGPTEGMNYNQVNYSSGSITNKDADNYSQVVSSSYPCKSKVALTVNCTERPDYKNGSLIGYIQVLSSNGVWENKATTNNLGNTSISGSQSISVDLSSESSVKYVRCLIKAKAGYEKFFSAITESPIVYNYSLVISAFNTSTQTDPKLIASADLFKESDVLRWVRLDEAVAAHSDSFTAAEGALTYTGQPIPCKGDWSIIMSASFNGEFGLEVSRDGKKTWENLQKWKTKDVGTLQDSGSEDDLCWIRLTATATEAGGIVQLNVDSFVNSAYAQISSYESPTKVYVKFTTNVQDKNFGIVENFKNQYYYAFDSWNDVNGYPKSVAFYQDRLCFASTTQEPLGVWLSAVGDYYTFKTEIDSQDDDSISINLVSQSLNESNSLVSKNDLLSFTPGGTWRINSRNPAQGLTAATIAASQQSFEGANSLQPLVINDRVLYVLELGATVRDISYDYTVDSYKGDDLTLLSRHLFRDNSIVSWCYAQEPDSLIWAVRDDGVLLSLTYVKEQDVYAWAKHTTNGKFVAVQSIPGDGVTDVYVIVERQNKLYVEVISKRYGSMKESTTLNYMDCSAVYSNEEGATEISGLDFLDGLTVQIFADGSIKPEQQVVDGKIKLQSPAKYVRVGLGYSKTLTTMNLDVQRQDGTSQGRKKRAAVIKVLLNNSYGGKIKTTGAVDDIRIDGMRLPKTYNSPIELQSGIFRNAVNASQDENLFVTVSQVDPLPINVLALMVDVEYGNS